jgi:hypothetical protein
MNLENVRWVAFCRMLPRILRKSHVSMSPNGLLEQVFTLYIFKTVVLVHI